jgi:hypothetical protein
MSETSLQNAYDRIEELELKLESVNERIRKLEEAGDAMAERCEVDIENWYRTKKGGGI